MFRLRWLTILVGILFAAVLSTATITVAARFSEESRSVIVKTDDYPDPGADPAHTPPPDLAHTDKRKARPPSGRQHGPPLKANDWNFLEKWGKLKDLSISLHIRVEDIIRMFNIPNVDTLHYEVRYLGKYIDEEYLSKIGLSTQAGRSHEIMLKKSTKCKIGAKVEGLTPTMLLMIPLHLSDDDIGSELKKVFSSENKVVEIVKGREVALDSVAGAGERERAYANRPGRSSKNRNPN
ncbi:hypothetical protein IEQ34_016294 [Dendrobium chrysotoxum]|uniref:Uncharacterized protein n=1 Tax=Dendrobium chrysotoxum TaxID=161865 RepID=A0AAV7GF52_DENCH|nr:hypothetical protein IEQ34_016294 [Dendrobium chrysotoxum]